nr:hypothetical protein [Eubacterium sp.]
MGFIKNFRRDFAQAVNELLPESEEKAGKKKKEKEKEIHQEAEPQVLQPVTEETPQAAVRDMNVQDAVSEAILREEADQLREEIRQTTEERLEQMNRELDEEIDSFPDTD